MLTGDNLSAWIVTYNRPEELNKNIRSLRASMPESVKITVVSNHSKCELFEDYPNVEVLYNTLRPDDSWGYLARNWNQCYYLGLDKTEFVLCTQDDTTFKPGWFEKINESEPRLFYSAPIGDITHLTSRDAFLKVGWWDERFICMDFQDYDYLNRVFTTIPDQCSICDDPRDMLWNDIGLSNFWVGAGYAGGDGTDRPRGAEYIHSRMNRIHYGQKRGIECDDDPLCHKRPDWRNKSLKLTQDPIDWYPWFTSKLQKITNKKQEFMPIPYANYYDWDGYR